MLFSASCGRKAAQTGGSLMGVWKVTQTKTVYEGKEYLNPNAQPGLIIFTERHYSIVWIPARESRKTSAKTWFPTDEEKVYDFDTIVVNSGTYEVQDSTLTVHPFVAKTPEFMGGRATYSYRLSGDKLWLTGTDIFSRDGVRDPGVDLFQTTTTLVKIE